LTGLRWLKGFLLTVTEEKLNTLNISRWFQISDPLSLSLTVSIHICFLKISRSIIFFIYKYKDCLKRFSKGGTDISILIVQAFRDVANVRSRRSEMFPTMLQMCQHHRSLYSWYLGAALLLTEENQKQPGD